MGKKNLSFSSYKKIVKYTYNDFNRWVTGLYIDAFREGQHEQQREAHNISFENELPKILMSVKGLGQKRVDAILKAIDDYYKEKKENDDGIEVERDSEERQ